MNLHSQIFQNTLTLCRLSQKAFCFLFIALAPMAFAQKAEKDNIYKNDLKQLDEYIKSQGYKNVISFDASNIKQYWVDNNVFTQNNTINILLEDNRARLNLLKSLPLKIQLANVDETMNCKVDVVTSNPDTAFAITNSKSKIISESSNNDTFIQYHIISSIVHLEDTYDSAFFMNFTSNSLDRLSIHKIVLSFSKNPESSFVLPPGSVLLKNDNYIIDSSVSSFEQKSQDGFEMKGKNSLLKLKNKIRVQDNDFSLSVKIKNNGDTAARVYVGYDLFTKDGRDLGVPYTPYGDPKKTFKVISAEKGSNELIVDSCPEWKSGCFLCLNAKDDLSDFPNFSLINGRIQSVTQLNDSETKIVLDKQLNETIKKGTSLRVNSSYGARYVYTNTKDLKPGEEAVLSSNIRKDDDFFSYSPKAFCRGTYFVQPIILLISSDPNKECAIMISDFHVSF